MGAALAAAVVGRDLVLPQQKKGSRPELPAAAPLVIPPVDFRFAPANWQSTYCFPDDPAKSLVGKKGELLYGHPGVSAEWDAFKHVVSVGLSGREPGKFVSQKLESPTIPVITTTLEWDDALLRLTSFATNEKEEGRIDNLLIEFTSRGNDLTLAPEILIESDAVFSLSSEDPGTLQLAPEPGVFMAVDSPVKFVGEKPKRCQLKPGTAKSDKALVYFARFPQEKQANVDCKRGDAEDLMKKCKSFWQSWKPTGGKIDWRQSGVFESFSVACSRNIMEAREIKNGKKLFQVGPTCYRGLWVVDGYSLLEAARYLGYDKEAQEGLESIWDRQAPNGSITAGGGESHYKDSAVAVFTLVRHAELTQDWEFFKEIYPDAFRAIDYLKQLRDGAKGNGTASGNYGILPKGFGDSGIGGIRSEFTNTLWTLVTLKRLVEVTRRLQLDRFPALNQFYGELRQAFYRAAKSETRTHPGGFTYLPMLMKDDPQWAEKDERKKPRPQAAQIYLSQSIFPGLLFQKDDGFVRGHIELMKAVTTDEDIPIETGWLTDDAAWPYNAAIVAQMYLWAGLPDLARRTFVGFLNHASPLYAWREEQSLLKAPKAQYVGDMPHNWASAECIRYLRHMIILEDEKNLRLFDGIAIQDIEAGKPIGLSYTPTRWGRVTVTLEPMAENRWQTKFKREDFDEKTMPPLSAIEMPAILPGGFGLEKLTGARRAINGTRALIPGTVTSWECTWRKL